MTASVFVNRRVSNIIERQMTTEKFARMARLSPTCWTNSNFLKSCFFNFFFTLRICYFWLTQFQFLSGKITMRIFWIRQSIIANENKRDKAHFSAKCDSQYRNIPNSPARNLAKRTRKRCTCSSKELQNITTRYLASLRLRTPRPWNLIFRIARLWDPRNFNSPRAESGSFRITSRWKWKKLHLLCAGKSCL